MLRADIQVRLGDLDLDVTLEVGDGEVVALLGPNGAGKTTVLRAVAGLQPLAGGRVELDGHVLDDVAAGVSVPTSERPVGVVFQDHLLFPHLSALDNVAFGLRARGAGRDEARAEAAAWLDRLGVGETARARPSALSGGQAQRVALARALAFGPDLLLLDEPLASLDASSRSHVRRELADHLGAFAGSRILVTHDPVDALVLADRLVVVEAGRITQEGTAADVARRPATRYVAELLGVNLLEGVAGGDAVVRLASGATVVVADPPPAGAVAVVVRPQAVALHRHRPEGSPRNAWEASVVALEADRGRVRVELGGPIPLVAEVTAVAAAELALRPGGAVWASVKAVDVTAHAR
jgi:molybdate transport system ATP-binding protein